MMSRTIKPKPARGGGVFIALLAIVGVLVGGLQKQPTLGLLGGLFLGGMIALILWWKDRDR